MDLGAKMLWTYSGIVIAAALLLQGVAAEATSPVTVEKTTVTLTCPLPGSGLKWYRKGTELSGTGATHQLKEFTYSMNGEYYCKNDSTKYHFYIRAKVCSDCIELNAGMVIGIIGGDLLFTLLVVGLVYWFAKRKGAASKDFRPLEHDDFPPSRPPHMSAAHQTEYAPIKGGQREVYDKLQRR